MFHECVCGETIPISEELCEACLAYCCKVLDVNPDTYEFYDDGNPALFEIYRFAWDNANDLKLNRDTKYWETWDNDFSFDDVP